jgi:hypothetical protein
MEYFNILRIVLSVTFICLGIWSFYFAVVSAMMASMYVHIGVTLFMTALCVGFLCLGMAMWQLAKDIFDGEWF